jgi:trk system potassium uptake protein TrkA
MYILIVGAGKVGYFLAKRLCQGKHVVSIVDKDKAICDEIAKELAKERFNVQRTVGRVNNPDNEHTFSELGIDVPVDSTKIIAKIIEEEVSFSDFVNLMSFKRGKLAIVRLDLPADSPVINQQVQDIQLPPDSVLVSIVRGEQVIVPKGNTVLKAGDDIIALTLVGNEPQLLNLLVGKI